MPGGRPPEPTALPNPSPRLFPNPFKPEWRACSHSRERETWCRTPWVRESLLSFLGCGHFATQDHTNTASGNIRAEPDVEGPAHQIPNVLVGIRKDDAAADRWLFILLFLSVALSAAKNAAERAGYVAVAVASASFMPHLSERKANLRGNLYSARIAALQAHQEAAHRLIAAFRIIAGKMLEFDQKDSLEAHKDATEAFSDYLTAMGKNRFLFDPPYLYASNDFVVTSTAIFDALSSDDPEKRNGLSVLLLLDELWDDAMYLGIAARHLLHIPMLEKAIVKVSYDLPFDMWTGNGVTQRRHTTNLDSLLVKLNSDDRNKAVALLEKLAHREKHRR